LLIKKKGESLIFSPFSKVTIMITALQVTRYF